VKEKKRKGRRKRSCPTRKNQKKHRETGGASPEAFKTVAFQEHPLKQTYFRNEGLKDPASTVLGKD